MKVVVSLWYVHTCIFLRYKMAAREKRYGPPLKLYDLCINAVVTNSLTSSCKYNSCIKDHQSLPNTVLLDFYERLYHTKTEGGLFLLAFDFRQLDILNRLLYVKGKKTVILRCYHMLNYTEKLNDTLVQTFGEYAVEKKGNRPEKELINMGLQVAMFLNEGGWYHHSIQFLNITETLIMHADKLGTYELLKLLECYRLRLQAEAHDCKFTNARETYMASKKVLRKLKKINALPNLARIYANLSAYKLIICEYNASFLWAMKALELLTTHLSKSVLIEVLRQASKACVVKRKFVQAGFLIRQALILGDTSNMKEQLHALSDIMMDYAFYLINSDAVKQSVDVYEKALSLRRCVFKTHNIHLAQCLEDLAYAVYVCEYSTGNFLLARAHSEKAIEYMEHILPKDHLHLASAKRVKALILEEIALDEQADENKRKDLLNKAEELHLTALRLCRKSLGDDNVQTAKHYGNLGRLYESKKQYEEAEKMHLKAIAIKEKLLGTQDYEVGLSIGHLASLYNYHMKKYEEAEKLYLRSIEINFILFGPAYSGLEYDYRGLMHVYTKTGEPDKYIYFNHMYTKWMEFRKTHFIKIQRLMSPKTIINIFFQLRKKEIVLAGRRARVARKILSGDIISGDDYISVFDQTFVDRSEMDNLSDQTSLLDLNETGSSGEYSQSDSDNDEEEQKEL